MSEQDFVDISPKVEYLKALRAHPAHYPLLLAEAADNALDAGATEIVIKITRNSISIKDNGHGIAADRYEAIFQLGHHSPIAGNPIGRYGMGVKVQAIAAGAVLDLASTTTSQQTLRARANWDAIIANGEWRIRKPLLTQSSQPPGTRIAVEHLDRAPSSTDIAKSRDEVIKMFFPALESCRIYFNDELLVPLPWPELTNIIEQDVSIRPGKGARVRAGMLRFPGGMLSQAALIYKHRVLRSQSTFGCGDYSGLTSMFARIDLFESNAATWTLAPFKNGLKDRDDNALEDAIEELLRPLLEQCHSASIDAVADELAEELTASLHPELHPARPRKKGKQIGEGPGGGTKNNPTKDADDTKSGPARTQRSPHLQIEFVDGLHREFGIGKFEPGRKLSRIQFAKDDPWIAFWLGRRDRQEALSALRAVAMGLYLHEKDLLQLDIEPYGLRLSKLLQRQQFASAIA